MANPFDYISLNNGTTTWKFMTNRDSASGVKEHVWIEDYEGILEPGSSSGSSTAKDYADGQTFDPNATISGKNINLDITIYHPNRAVRRNLFDEFINFLKPMNYILDTDWKGPYTCQYSDFILHEGGKGTEDYFSGTLTLISKEGW